MNYLLGVDAGNTKTIALIARADGSIAGYGRAGCGDIYGAGAPAPALAETDRAVAAALAMAGIAPDDLAASAFSMAGADWPEDFALLETAMRSRGLGRRIVVHNDAIGALRAGSPSGTGVVVACGTAAAVGARGTDGRVWHSSFWQETGGNDHLGDKAFRAVLRAELGIAPPTLLTERVLRCLGFGSVEAMLHAHTARERDEASRPDTGLLGRVLLDAAADGDPTARQIVVEHGEALADYALVAARNVGLVDQPFPLVLAGGVFRHPSPLLREALVARVQAAAPGAQPTGARLEPAAGALLLAFELAGVAVDTALLAELEASLPPSTFFAT
jgi:N-acetylglucosamine kinase-like BadF-type ATPase